MRNYFAGGLNGMGYDIINIHLKAPATYASFSFAK